MMSPAQEQPPLPEHPPKDVDTSGSASDQAPDGTYPAPRLPADIGALVRYPVTAATAIAAIVVFVIQQKYPEVPLLLLDFRAWEGEVWRFFTSAFVHINIFHLGFNLYWLWLFGTRNEGVIGSLRTAGLYMFLEVGSGLAEYALADGGGVGLSGVGYGLFGFLLVLARKDPRFAGSLTPNISTFFIGWFFLCIALTVSKVMAVGNVAHGMGFVFGFLAGEAGAAEGNRRRYISVVIAILWLAMLPLASIARPWVNVLAQHPGHDLSYQGYLDLVNNRNERAVARYRRALEYDPSQADWWFNLGIGLQALGQFDEARAAFEQAVKLRPGNEDFRGAVEYLDTLRARDQ